MMIFTISELLDVTVGSCCFFTFSKPLVVRLSVLLYFELLQTKKTQMVGGRHLLYLIFQTKGLVVSFEIKGCVEMLNMFSVLYILNVFKQENCENMSSIEQVCQDNIFQIEKCFTH